MAASDRNVAALRHVRPERTCVACRARFAQVQLLRLTRSPDGKLVVGPLAPGRGAYVCASAGCLALLTRKRTLGRALRVEISPDAVALLVAELTKRLCV